MARRGVGCLMLYLLLTGGCFGSEEQARPASGPTLTATVARELDARLREKVDDAGIPGASAAVVFPDGRVWEGAAGAAVLEPARLMTSQTSLPFAGVTKLATAALALRLVEQGRLALDDPIDRWYAAWRGDPEATIRDLLGHTAGLSDPPDGSLEALSLRGDATPRQWIAATPKPGPRTTTAEYSNTGFMITGLILARAAGRPVAAAMRQELFAHPGGDGLAFQPVERPHPPLAHAYWHPDETLERVDASDGSRLLPFRGDATMAFTAGALAGDVPSLARWSHELLSGKILKPASLRDMTRFHRGAHWPGYGLGLARDHAPEGNHELWGHSGEITGSRTELWHLPSEQLTIAIAWNDDRPSGPAAELLPVLLRAALGSEP